MRIIGGKHRSRVLKEFKDIGVRPTSDRARESLFNILSGRIEGASFLDLFAGTGAVGIEAISRGAEKVEFVDKDKQSLEIVKFNLQSVKQNIEPKFKDAKSYLTQTPLKFDYIFLDPPYAFNEEGELFNLIKQRQLLNGGGIIIFEHKSDKSSQNFEGFTLTDTRRYGIAVFDFYKESL